MKASRTTNARSSLDCSAYCPIELSRGARRTTENGAERHSLAHSVQEGVDVLCCNSCLCGPARRVSSLKPQLVCLQDHLLETPLFFVLYVLGLGKRPLCIARSHIVGLRQLCCTADRVTFCAAVPDYPIIPHSDAGDPDCCGCIVPSYRG